MKVLVTGAAGFIGFHVCRRLLKEGHEVWGADNFRVLGDRQGVLKRDRLQKTITFQLKQPPGFYWQWVDVSDRNETEQLFADHSPFDRVIHLAARTGVRESVTEPLAYVQSNLVGFANVLECCRQNQVPHLLYASSSSVYGYSYVPQASSCFRGNASYPLSLYGATKRANELMAHSYSHLYGLRTTGLRFFTVYGPWGRPDMAVYKFAKAIDEGRPVELYGDGTVSRDFTYIDDAVRATIGLMSHSPAALYMIQNIGMGNPVALSPVIRLLETYLGKKAEVRLAPTHLADVPKTWADTTGLPDNLKPQTPIETGLRKFVDWFRDYHSQSTDETVGNTPVPAASSPTP